MPFGSGIRFWEDQTSGRLLPPYIRPCVPVRHHMTVEAGNSPKEEFRGVKESCERESHSQKKSTDLKTQNVCCVRQTFSTAFAPLLLPLEVNEAIANVPNIAPRGTTAYTTTPCVAMICCRKIQFKRFFLSTHIGPHGRHLGTWCLRGRLNRPTARLLPPLNISFPSAPQRQENEIFVVESDESVFFCVQPERLLIGAQLIKEGARR